MRSLINESCLKLETRFLFRKTWPSDMLHRPIKRLFTPEIKRMLKDWLVRRRENPYPSRDEKKILAVDTGLTYTQICNWFANWRRKLKNSGKQKAKKNWGNLIKNYNTSARGNVEQFSICSSDSIWGENNILNDNVDDDGSYSSDSSAPKKYEMPKLTRKRVKRASNKNVRLKERRKMMGASYKTPNVSSLYNNFCGSNAFTPPGSKSSYFQVVTLKTRVKLVRVRIDAYHLNDGKHCLHWAARTVSIVQTSFK